jgi:hypothetical protein
VDYNFTFYAMSDGMASVRGELIDITSSKVSHAAPLAVFFSSTFLAFPKPNAHPAPFPSQVLASSPDVAPDCGPVWCRYSTLIKNTQVGSMTVMFQLVASGQQSGGTAEGGVLWLDHISLVPTDAVVCSGCLDGHGPVPRHPQCVS